MGGVVKIVTGEVEFTKLLLSSGKLLQGEFRPFLAWNVIVEKGKIDLKEATVNVHDKDGKSALPVAENEGIAMIMGSHNFPSGGKDWDVAGLVGLGNRSDTGKHVVCIVFQRIFYKPEEGQDHQPTVPQQFEWYVQSFQQQQILEAMLKSMTQ